MKVSEANNKFCPFKQGGCITSSCMLWVVTVDSKKEVDRHIMPSYMYPKDGKEGSIQHTKLINKGYKEISSKVFVKYEECYEGYCALNKEVRK